jgi:hypothetical protein
MQVYIDPPAKIRAKLGLNPDGRIQKHFTELCKDRMEKFVPKRDGPLRDTAYIEGNNVIVYPQKYARYQYKGEREDGSHKINPENYTTKGTGPYWDRRMVSAEMKNIERILEKEMRRGRG